VLATNEDKKPLCPEKNKIPSFFPLSLSLKVTMADQHLLEETETFASFDFDPRLSRAIAQMQFVHPTLVQAKAIPLAMAGKDILARARTGSGKTAAYTLPIVQKLLLNKEVSRSRSVCHSHPAY
jgi:superfamily II DNA/RNA helicase